VDIKGSVQQQFGSVAANYVTSAVHARGADLERIGQEAGALKPTLALDVGTAAGHVALVLAPHAATVVGLDLTAAMLEQARGQVAERGAANVRLVRGDVEQLPFVGGRVDLATSRYSAHHYPHPAAFAAEVARVLRPGGQLLLSDTVAPPDQELDEWIDQVERLRDPSHVRDHTVAEWHRYLVDAGLRVDTLVEWHLMLDFEHWVERMNTPAGEVEQLRALMRDAPDSHRAAFEIGADADGRSQFALHAALIRATKV
jgi:ubiquinone/menaquinone biosynthesis C-methylase UbiE